jgi:protein SCO1
MSRVALVAGLLIALLPLTSIAHDHSNPSSGEGMLQKPEGRSPAALEESARSYFTDLPVIAQDGKERRFFSEILKDKIVLIYLFYTHCEDACPLVNQKIAGVQDLLGDRVGADITLISITTDPSRDTPPVVQKYSEYFNARPGWLFLTGETQNIETIVRKLGQTSSDPTDHVAVLMVGNVRQAKWTKVTPTASEAEIADMLRLLAGDRKG